MRRKPSRYGPHALVACYLTAYSSKRHSLPWLRLSTVAWRVGGNCGWHAHDDGLGLEEILYRRRGRGRGLRGDSKRNISDVVSKVRLRPVRSGRV